MKTITVPVEGLNFASCAQSIEKRLGTFSGVQEVAASYVTQTATITFDEADDQRGDDARFGAAIAGLRAARPVIPWRCLLRRQRCDSRRRTRLARRAGFIGCRPPPAHDHIHEHPMDPIGGIWTMLHASG